MWIIDQRPALARGTGQGVLHLALGRDRDDGRFAMLDREWPAIRAAFERWLAPENFDAEGRQRARLRALMTAR